MNERQRMSASAETAPRQVRPGYLHVHLRSRVEVFKGSDVWDAVEIERTFPAAETAILLCDVWNDHWCRGAAQRVDAMVPTMNAVVEAARANGIQIIHAPSETMDFYADAPHRQRMLVIPRVTPPEPRDLPDPLLPIDASDGGCDSDEKPWHKAWTRQHPGISIDGDDVISDNGVEIYSFLVQQGIKNLAIMGVHTNMCVLNRSFAIKQMTRWGIRCILVRDLTDALYNPEMPPHVSHMRGTELVIEHIEKHWCPTVSSKDLTEVYETPR